MGRDLCADVSDRALVTRQPRMQPHLYLNTLDLGGCLRKVSFFIQVVDAKMTKVTFQSEISD